MVSSAGENKTQENKNLANTMIILNCWFWCGNQLSFELAPIQ